MKTALILLAAAMCWGQDAPAYWLKRYPLRDYGAFWHLELTVRDGKKAREKALKLLSKRGSAPVVPVENMASSDKFVYQQLSYAVPRKEGEKVVEGLKKLGQVKRFSRKDALEPDAASEVQTKLSRLRFEKEAGGEILKRLTVVNAVIEELCSHLEKVDDAYKKSSERILLNISMEEQPKK
ncbi:MAG: hypothetical protein WC728_13145 [Elusimicrobiota bacterium]